MGDKIKVLHVIATLNHGGAENVAVNFYRLLNKEKYTCDYLIYVNENRDYETEIRKLGGRVFCISNPHKNFIKWHKEINEIFDKYGPYDIVHSHNLFHSGDVLKVAKRKGVSKRIAHSHTTSSSYGESKFKKIYDAFMRYKVQKYATDYVACGKEAGEYLFGKDFFNEKGLIINNDINLDLFRYNKELRNKYRKKLNIDDNEFTMINVGRLLEVKNQLFLIELVKDLLEKDVKVKLLIAGSGLLEDKIKDKIKTLDLENNITLLGNRDDIAQLLNAADLFLMPSLFEGLPLALIEAQANGMHVIASNKITTECNITGLIRFLPIDQGTKLWTQEIIENINNYNRVDTSQIIINKKYDTDSNKKIITELYRLD